MTQKALAEELGLEYYTMISQMELGYISIPATLWEPLASTLGMDKSRFVLDCMTEYHPDIYEALFRKRSVAESATILSKYRKGEFDHLLN